MLKEVVTPLFSYRGGLRGTALTLGLSNMSILFGYQIVDINNGRAIKAAPMATVSKSEAELLTKFLLNKDVVGLL